MKKINGFILILILVITTITVNAEIYEQNFTSSNSLISIDDARLRVISLRYDPYPVNPDEYFTIWIKAENIGSDQAENAVFELVPEYPFYLDSNEDAIREYGILPSYEPVVLEYKVRVDKDAVEGANDLTLKYSSDGETWLEKDFTVTVTDAQTDFDLVIQEASDSEVSIALANTGDNVAYSVIVRIPEQEDYQTTGIDGQMVGNLEDGDYTLVGFELETTSRNPETLEVQIDYTDEIGERRTLLKDIKYGTDGDLNTEFNSTTLQGVPGSMRGSGQFQQTTSTSYYQQWWFWVIVLGAVYALWKTTSFLRKRKELKEMEEAKKHKK
ncbi:hypothetical protein C0585_05990 [Candidatus Woesearchaeota archaeon]|nr:MAG: hypothetical protein C0585_05990 [Candidatus Woesearchaeota archaeon]